MKQIGSDLEMVVPDVRFKDVILESSVEDQVRRLISAVRHLPSVLCRWKIGGVGGDRGGVVGLLHGLPGTGKTLCAESIAGELNRPLMVARSSTILSKWVGESERNLQSLFKEAKANGAVLFIDEADSMIGQRDKSNSEHSRSLINLLLSLIERHSGVVLLATNFRDGLDSALERRITHQVELKRPTAEMRRRIWELMLSEETLGVQELKLDELSARYELSGAEIRVVLLRAATAAFEEGESGLTQTLLEREAAQLLGAQQKSKSIGFGVSRGA
jgi:SpoVK/Ycf46/Vps4 family AAA+-type ATPase